ncbi:unnamed protein product [Closterium sp. Naga37s-1]|nr:unnamed protein product [Closterium sp. Naga37s-1]
MAMVLALSPPSLLVRSDVRTANFSGSKAGEIHGARLRFNLGTGNRRFELAGETSRLSTRATNPRRIATNAVLGQYQQTNPNYGDFVWEEPDCAAGGKVVSRSHRYSHEIVRQALEALSTYPDYQPDSWDILARTPQYYSEGAFMVTSVPWELLDSWQQENGREPLDRLRTVVGMMFLPPESADAAKQLVEGVIEAEGNKMQVIGWREVLVNRNVLGNGWSSMPSIHQLILSTPNWVVNQFPDEELNRLKERTHLAANGEWVEVEKSEQKIVRVRMEKADEKISSGPSKKVHVCSLTDKFIVY